MAAPGPSNVVVRHAIDEIVEFIGETETPKYIKVFILQQIAESRHHVRVLHEEADIARNNDSDDGEVLDELIEKVVAYFDPFLPMNIITRKAYNTIMVEELESTGKNLVAIVRDVYLFVGSFTYITDFVVLEDIGEFIQINKAEVVMGKPFRKITKLEYDCAKGLMSFNRIFDNYTFQMPHTIPRLKHWGHVSWSKIPPILWLNQRDLTNGFKNAYEKNKFLYKNCLNLGPEYQVDESMKEWLIQGHMSIHGVTIGRDPIWGCDRLVSRAKVIENQVMAISIILVSSDSSEESVRTSTGRVILFGTIPTTIPDTTLSRIPTSTHVDTTLIPIVSPTIPPSSDYTPASPDYTPASPDYSPVSDMESDPSEDSSDIPDTPPSSTHGTPFTETTLSTQRSSATSGALRLESWFLHLGSLLLMVERTATILMG
nr:homeodomain-like protein [Tanacetum cinerariifolium]